MSVIDLQVPVSRIGLLPLPFAVVADSATLEALARQFGLLALDRFEADVQLRRAGDGWRAEGQLRAAAVQACVVSGEPVPALVDAPLAIDFLLPGNTAGEVELDSDAPDSVLVEGDRIDLGSAIAESLALALDPYPRAPDDVLAQARRHLLSEEEAERLAAADAAARNPFNILKR